MRHPDQIRDVFSPLFGFRLMGGADCERVFHWRNSDAVRPFMRHTDPIAWDNHTAWFARMLASPTDLYFIYQPADAPLGLLCFNRIDPQAATAEWGFYLGEPALPPGTGTAMLRAALSLAFEEIGLRWLTAEVLPHNPRSRHLHEKLGFVREGTMYRLCGPC